MPSMRFGFSASRSSIASGVPAARAAARSSALAPGWLARRASTIVGRGVQRASSWSRCSRWPARGRRRGPAARRRAPARRKSEHATVPAHSLTQRIGPAHARSTGVRSATAGLALTVMAARVCVVGSVNADLTFTVDALPRPGQTVLASSLSSAPGGKGGNQAVAAARAGATVQLVAALGTDSAAEQLRAHLRDNERRPRRRGQPARARAARRRSSSTPRRRTPSSSRPGANAHLTRDLRRRPRRDRRQRRRAAATGDPDRNGRRRRAGRAGGGRSRHRQRVTRWRETPRPARPVRAGRRRRRQRGRGARMALARTASGDHPRCARRKLPRRTTNGSTCPPRRSRPSTPPARATCSPECWPRAGWTATRTRCAGPARRARCRRWCRAPATAHRTPRPSTTR